MQMGEYRAHYRANAAEPTFGQLARAFVEIGNLDWTTETKKRQ
jgi:hypothetical protein